MRSFLLRAGLQADTILISTYGTKALQLESLIFHFKLFQHAFYLRAVEPNLQ